MQISEFTITFQSNKNLRSKRALEERDRERERERERFFQFGEMKADLFYNYIHSFLPSPTGA